MFIYVLVCLYMLCLEEPLFDRLEDQACKDSGQQDVAFEVLLCP